MTSTGPRGRRTSWIGARSPRPRTVRTADEHEFDLALAVVGKPGATMAGLSRETGRQSESDRCLRSGGHREAMRRYFYGARVV
jgi:hypothetical protein